MVKITFLIILLSLMRSSTCQFALNSLRQNTNSNELIQSLYRLNITNNIDLRYQLEKALVRLRQRESNSNDTICQTQFNLFIDSLFNGTLWAIKIVDSFGKLPSGIAQGDKSWFGDYSECVNSKSDDRLWTSKYCLIAKPFDVTVRQGVTNTDFRYGLCFPKECNTIEIADILNFISAFTFNLLPFVDPLMVQCQNKKPIDTNAIVAICILSLIVLIALLGTAIDLYKIGVDYFQKEFLPNMLFFPSSKIIPKNKEEKIEETKKLQKPKQPAILTILSSFSLYTNSIKLFKVTNVEGQIDCLHAIRFMSMGWVVLGHLFSYGIVHIDNLSSLVEWSRRFTFQMVLGGTYAVDSFFLLSGILVAYLFMKEATKKGITFGFMMKYYLHRLWRITPPYMIMLMISATLTKYLGSGPIWPDGFEYQSCKNTWWTNLLYINNFFDLNRLCFAETWYLAVDMQFHWLAPIVLIPLGINKVISVIIGLAIAGFLLIGNIISTALIIDANDGAEYGSLSPVYLDKIYFYPWGRFGPFVIGLLYGYMIFYFKTNRINFRIKSDLNLMLWLITLIMMGLMVFGLYPEFKDPEFKFSRTVHILFQTFCRNIWAAGLGFIVFSCTFGGGGFMNSFLTWKIWTVLSRLSFSAYLMHMTVLFTYFYSQDRRLHFQDINVAFIYVASMVIIYALSVVFSLLFEIPLVGLDRLLFKR